MKRMIIPLAVAAILAAGLLALAGCASSGGGSVSANPTAKVPITVKAEGWTDASTPVIIHVVSDDGKVDFCRAIDANKAGEIPLADGSYRLFLITPINADGSIYTVPDAGTLTVKDGKADALEFSLARIEADDVTNEQMEQAVKDIAAATAKGDGTLSGSKAKAVREKAAKNAAAAGKVDEAEASASAEAASSEAAAAVEQSRAQQASGGNGGGTPQGGSAAPAGGNGGGSSSGGSEPGPSQHVHTWVQQQVGTESVWIVDQSAWDEQVAVGEHIHCSCGMDWYSVDSYIPHQDEALCRYSVVTDYEWVHHDEVGHYEDRAIYQTVCSGCGAVA